MTLRRRLFILGSTGSIGENALVVAKHLAATGSTTFEIVGLAAGKNWSRLLQQAKESGTIAIALADEDADAQAALRAACSPSTQLFCGPDAALQLIQRHARRGDLVLGAMVGSAGVAPILAAIEAGCDIALANKETLVAAGALVIAAAKRVGVSIVPVDSEHSAIFQCLQTGDTMCPTSQIERIVLTASGGPFRRASLRQMQAATLADALNHPTWSMGSKVTIDSASMMNKALEMIEAHWLFELPAHQIDVIVHPQSIVHSFVEFIDGSVLAQMSPPDMKLPIQFAMTFPERAIRCATPLNWQTLRGLEFEAVDHARFPAIALASRAIQRGGTSGAILNGANEAAVEAFIQCRISFVEIASLVAGALEAIEATPADNLDNVLRADARARAWVQANVVTDRLPLKQ
ncbi:MAG: 1-deoxy-D-xylulose-5-phosphate reductoisomerase [Phycisphaerales bacterium]|nr:1-deoxy-D-xylulose-5-phosphate reductoisomerase [Phycisphaerales bacterium]